MTAAERIRIHVEMERKNKERLIAAGLKKGETKMPRFVMYHKKPWDKRLKAGGFYTDDFERQKKIADNRKKEFPRDVIKIRDTVIGKYVYTA